MNIQLYENMVDSVDFGLDQQQAIRTFELVERLLYTAEPQPEQSEERTKYAIAAANRIYKR